MSQRRKKGRRWRPKLPAINPAQSVPMTVEHTSKEKTPWLRFLNVTLTILVSITILLTYFGIKGCNPPITIKIMVKDIETEEAIPYAKLTSNLSPGDTLTATSGGGIDLSIKGRAGEKILISAWADGYQRRVEYYTIQSAIPIDLTPEINSKQ